MVPKIIHFVWVGNGQKSELIERCIESWKRFLPDYQIMEWNNESLASIDCEYVSQAFQAKKWAFVSDYLRLYALYHFGGFYFDADLEITNNIEQFRHHHFVTGFESYKGRLSPITALMGAIAFNPLIKDLLDEYTHLKFIKEDGSFDQTTNTFRITQKFIEKGWVTPPFEKDEVVELPDESCIYPSYYFCTPKIGLPNFSIHHFGGSWVTKVKRKVTLNFKNFRFVLLKRKSHYKNSDIIIPLESNESIISQRQFGRYDILILRLKFVGDKS